MSSAAIIVPSICEIINILNQDKTDENSVNEIATSIYNLANYVGEALGPFIGGLLTTNFSFHFSCVSMSILNLLFFSSYSLFYLKYIKDDLSKFLNNSTVTEEENKIDSLILDYQRSIYSKRSFRKYSFEVLNIQRDKREKKELEIISSPKMNFNSIPNKNKKFYHDDL